MNEDDAYEEVRNDACNILDRRGINLNEVEPDYLNIIDADWRGDEQYFVELVAAGRLPIGGRRFPDLDLLDETAMDESLAALSIITGGKS